MYDNSSALGSARSISLSSEYLNQEQSLITIPPPMCNLQYDPPHLSRWQQHPSRNQGLSSVRSGSAITTRNDSTHNAQQQHQQALGAINLSDQFRALTLHPRNHCDPHRASTIRPGILNANIYELSDDLRAREIDLMERYYGGRLRAQRAARLIQAKYREYRMRAQYAKLRSDRRFTGRKITDTVTHYRAEEQREAMHLASMEDLVIDRAYLDWDSEPGGSGVVGSIPDLTVEGKTSRCSAPSAATQSPDGTEVSSQSCSNLIAVKNNQKLLSSPGTGTGSTSGFFSSPGSCSSSSLTTEHTQILTISPKPEAVTKQPSEHKSQQSVLYYLMDGEEQQVPQQLQQLYIAVPMKADQRYLQVVSQQKPTPQQQQQQQHPRHLTQPTTAATVLVRRCSTGSNSNQTPVWRSTDGKIYTLAFTEKPKPVIVSPPHPTSQSFSQPVFVTPIRKDGSGNTPVLVKLNNTSSSSSAGFVQMGQRPTMTSIPSISDRWRKRLYRICLNYFNKTPVKGIDMLIKFGFLDASPRQIARFLLTRKGLYRSAIGEYLGEIKHDLSVATSHQFMRELDFREMDVDGALRILMSRFRTPGESQKIVHLLNEFQSAYIEQNAARVNAQFRNPDSVMILAYAVIMLHTDMYSPNIRPASKMTRQEFVKNLRGVDDGEDLDSNLLLSIYDRIQSEEMRVAPDHTDQVRKIHHLLTGPLRPTNLVTPQRRLVCYCRLYEVPDKTKRDRPGAHQREIFLFNDILLITKAFQKRRKDSSAVYQVRACINLIGTWAKVFETPQYANGISLYRVERTDNQKTIDQQDASTNHQVLGIPLINLNTKTTSDKLRLLDDLQECIMETTEMDRIRLDDVLFRTISPLKSTDTTYSSSSSHFQQHTAPLQFCKCYTEPTMFTTASTQNQPVCVSAGRSSGQRTFIYKTPESSR